MLRRLLFVIVRCTLLLALLAWPLAAVGALSPAPVSTASAPATSIIYGQPPSLSGGLLQSSWWDPNGSDYDQCVWDDFTLSSTHDISEIRWRGGYDPTHFGMGGPVIDFTVSICASIAGAYQPDVINPPLVQYQAGGNAGETAAGTFGSAAMYDYTFALPAPFQAMAGTTYWVQIEATQHGIPDWGMATGTGGDNRYFRRIANVGDIYYQIVPGDAAFTLLGPTVYSASIYLPLIQD